MGAKVPGARPPSTPVIHRGELWERMCESAELLAEVVAMFRADLPTMLETLRAAAAADNSGGARGDRAPPQGRAPEPLREAGGRAREHARAGRSREGAAAQVEALAAECRAVERELEQFVAESSVPPPAAPPREGLRAP